MRKAWVFWRWYSMCSAHRDFQPRCIQCAYGAWVFEPAAKASRAFYRLSPSLWRKVANRHSLAQEADREQ